MNVEIDVPTIRGRCTPLRKSGSNNRRRAIDGRSRDFLRDLRDLDGCATPQHNNIPVSLT
jgi:hypothetical protein